MKKTTISLAVATTVALAGALSVGAAYADEGDDDTTTVTEETVSMDDAAEDEAEAEDAESEDAGSSREQGLLNPAGHEVDDHAAHGMQMALANSHAAEAGMPASVGADAEHGMSGDHRP